MLFATLVERLQPAAIVETGTYLGTTTEWMAGFQVPIFTCERSMEHFGFARARLSALPNVTVALADSREFLRGLLAMPLGAPAIFYLDAHGDADLPLADEIHVIFALCPKAVALIDDFQVPDDAGYGYDAYGPGQILNASCIGPVIGKQRLSAFYPTTPSSMETGMRRGCVVLCKDKRLIDTLSGISLLRRLQSVQQPYLS
jgi:hypothetical protein